MGHDEDGPLRPTYNVERPPWIGLYSDRTYKGQPEYWAEPGLKDSVVRKGQFRGNRAAYKEESRDFFDPAVPDGTSLTGPNGLDSTRTPNLAVKGDQPGNLAEFQKKIMEGSLQYKRIAEKYNLSKEHPGLAVSPTLSTLQLTPVENLGILNFNKYNVRTWGPRFFDKPLNEGTAEKVAAAAKYTAVAMIPLTFIEIRATHSVKVADFTPREYFKRYLKLSPIPFALTMSWAFAISSSAAIRNKDDVYNHYIAGATTGLVLATIKNNLYLGFLAAATTTVLGLAWQYQRVSEYGLQGRTPPQSTAGFHGGPLGWQLTQQGDAAVPNRAI
uniref:NADH dehydrogenase [ubiquinone] 1 alpha subcomplex subunit 11 n=1 Tax=Panagrellus redivivus TaxID=6233 RepID=A0A7E4VYD7_PANRE